MKQVKTEASEPAEVPRIQKAPVKVKDKYDKQIDILNGRAINNDIENAALIVFNIYKSMHNKTYLLDSWNDCSSHIKSVSHD